MIKQILASLFLLILLGVVIYNVVDERQAATDEKTQSQELSEAGEGAGMISPNAPSGLKVGEKAPDFSLETLDGQTVKLSDYKGKKVFLNFWATWCPPCQEEMPEMEKFHKEYGKEVEVLAINGTAAEENIGVVKEYVEEGGYTFPVLLDKELETTNTYQAISIPTTYFIGTDGVVQQPRKVGPMTYDFMIKMKDQLN
ncbi:TlpA disulfide reductase family protein [Halobacillus sp. BBL2006]|uniref:TlpA disulfide reductase family protein n=1 Tax=Halobacillus sp. BBL2006 TaxID=1543706 RepID=UPI0005441D3E|nr:TlpA disulfide reductase family protein [Halobacillus sp. BBL2006]KHE67743.1 cytochrome C biogenesis protein [Halobacillus sp. BBL2006]